jgi:hypothetical protein
LEVLPLVRLAFAPLIAAAITKNRINMDTLGRIEHGVFA